MEEYEDISFVKEDGSYDYTTNVVRVTERTRAHYPLQLGSSYQDLGDVVFYPSDYFCPKNWESGILHVTENTCVIHHFAASWHDEKTKRQAEKYRKRLQKYVDKYGEELGKYKLLRADSVKFYLTHPHKIFRKLITGKRD
jgi:hypothetical protein